MTQFLTLEFQHGYHSAFATMPNGKTARAVVGLKPKGGDIWQCMVMSELPKTVIVRLLNCLKTEPSPLSHDELRSYLESKAAKIILGYEVGYWQLIESKFSTGHYKANGLPPTAYLFNRYLIQWPNDESAKVEYISTKAVTGWDNWLLNKKGVFNNGLVECTINYKDEGSVTFSQAPTLCETFVNGGKVYQSYATQVKVGDEKQWVICQPLDVRSIVPVMDLEKVKVLLGGTQE